MTHTPPTSQQLDEIEARADVATDGPWERYEKYGPDFFACTSGSYLRGVGTFNFGDGTDAAADEEFVKHAVQDVRLLVDEVRRLRAALITVQADTLGEIATDLEGIDFHPSAKSNCRSLCQMLAGRFRRKALERLDAARPAAAVAAVAETGQ